jgi:hypothetical protein
MTETFFARRHFTHQVLGAVGFDCSAGNAGDFEVALPDGLEKIVASLMQQVALLRLSSIERLLLHSNHSLLRTCWEVCQLPVENWPENTAELGWDIVDWWIEQAPKMVQLDTAAELENDELWFLQKTSEKVRIHPALLTSFLEVLLDCPVFYSSLSVAQGVTPADVEVEQLFAHGPQVRWKELSCSPEKATELVRAGKLRWILPTTASDPSWASKLYQYLGFLEGGSREPLITETAFLLQWLRTAVRTLPFQELPVAIETMEEIERQLKAYFERNQKVPPTVKTEEWLLPNSFKIAENDLFLKLLNELRVFRGAITGKGGTQGNDQFKG